MFESGAVVEGISVTLCAICGTEADQLHTCSECGRQVCDSCYVEAMDMCADCEETWEAEEDLDFV